MIRKLALAFLFVVCLALSGLISESASQTGGQTVGGNPPFRLVRGNSNLTINASGSISYSVSGAAAVTLPAAGYESPLTFSSPLSRSVNTISCATCGLTGSPLSQFAATTSAQFLGVISNESGSGVVMGNDTPTILTPNITGNLTIAGNILPDAAGTRTICSSALPCSSVYVGSTTNQRTQINTVSTGPRAATFPNKSGTVAFLDDIVAGITNSAASGVVPVTIDGSGNLGTSQATQTINTTASGHVTIIQGADSGDNPVSITVGGDPSLNIIAPTFDVIGDFAAAGSNAVSLSASTDNIGINGTSHTINLTAGTAINITGASLNLNGNITANKTITAGGTVGAQTINKTAGSVNFAAAATSLVVTNSLVDANSIIICTVATNDATLKSVQCVAASGSFTMFGNAAAAAETRVNFLVIN